jgi:hypothetical protein
MVIMFIGFVIMVIEVVIAVVVNVVVVVVIKLAMASGEKINHMSCDLLRLGSNNSFREI